MQQLPKDFNRWGLVTPLKPKKRRLLLTCAGETGVGKSDLALRTAPRPALFINLDRNIDGVEEKYLGDEVYIHTITIPAEFDMKRDREILDEVVALFQTAVTSKYFRSITWDTFAHMYTLARRGLLGKAGFEFGETKRTDFGLVNALLRSFFDDARNNRVNMIATAHLKDEYKGGKVPTGRKIPEGWKHLTSCAQMHVVLSKDPTESGLKKFKCMVEKCTTNMYAEGQELVGEEITFANLGTFAYPQSENEDWT